MTNKFIKNSDGFTLIELIVALGIFGLVVGMTSGVFINALSTQSRILASRHVSTNISFLLESMAREIRTGSNFSSGAGSLSFTNAKGQSVTYRLIGNVIEKSSDGGATYAAATGPEVTVNYLNFYLSGLPLGDGLQPRVTVTIGLTSKVGKETSTMNIQTTLSQIKLQI